MVWMERRSRLACIAILVGGCGQGVAVPVTHRVAVFGYPDPPALAVITRGKPEAVEPWLHGLEAARSAQVIIELPKAPTDNHRSKDKKALVELCREAISAAGQGRTLDKILVLDVITTIDQRVKCVETASSNAPVLEEQSSFCVTYKYLGVTSTAEATLTVMRPSTCETIRRQSLASISRSAARARGEIIGYTGPSDAIRADHAAATGEAHDVLRNIATRVDWDSFPSTLRGQERIDWVLFPRSFPIVRRDGRTIDIGDRGTLSVSGKYMVRTATGKALVKGVELARTDGQTLTLRVAPELPLVDHDDELHVIDSMRDFMLNISLSGGVVNAGDSSHASAGISVSLRYTFEPLPLFVSAHLDGDLVPGLDAARSFGLGGSGGLRLPIGPIAPYVFGELGITLVHQGSDGARAVGYYPGLGAGIELRFTRWYLMLDARRRWLDLGAWKDADDAPVTVMNPDRSWRSTTFQLGGGTRF